MIRFCEAVVFLICLSKVIDVHGSFSQDKVLRLEPKTEEQINYLRYLEDNGLADFWTEIIAPNRDVDVHIGGDVFDEYTGKFRALSMPYTIVVDNLQSIIDQEQIEINQERVRREIKNRLLGNTRADILGTYVSYGDIVQFLKEKESDNPSAVRVLNIGSTFEKRDINIIQLKYNSASTRNIWIDCGIHAREWITPAVCVWIIDKLIEDYKNGDSRIQDLLNHWTVYVAPSLNPDGYEYSRTNSQTRLWRKSRNTNTGSTCRGVDLNRNYPEQWLTGGSSTSACSDTFAGKSAASESETKAVVNFLETRIGTWDMYMSFHSYGQWWFTPYGYSNKLPQNYQLQYNIARNASDVIESVNKRKYTVGSVANLLYIASGSTVDWAFDKLKCPFSYTIELPPTDAATGFVLPVSLAPGVCNETYIGMKEFLVNVKRELQSSLGR